MHRVIFYQTNAGRPVLNEWLRTFSKPDRAIIGEDLMTIQLGFPMGLPLCRSLGSGLWEARTSLSGRREVRLIFFHDAKAKALVVVHGFLKTSQKTQKPTLIWLIDG